jgi:hypothetical protein
LKSFKNLTLKEKKRFLDDPYYYEVSMLFHSFFFNIVGDSQQAAILKNIRLESFILHARNLIEFYYEKSNSKKERIHEDDAWAVDFFKEKELWLNIRPDIKDWKRKFEKRAAKELAHLTYSRLEISPENKIWNIFEIANPIKEISILFIDNIDEILKTQKILSLQNYLESLK